MFSYTFAHIMIFEPSQDHILPYMTDVCHAPDTLFFVAEEDWRLFLSEEAWLSQSPPYEEDAPDWSVPGLPDMQDDEDDVWLTP